MSNFLDEMLQAQKRGEVRGIPSLCSAHPWVLQAAVSVTGTGPSSLGHPQASLKHMRSLGPHARTMDVLLVETTCNQVNQFGGYTGMTPAAFVSYLHGMAAADGLSPDRLILGGDHLGPGPWQNEPAGSAMQKAAEMVQAYVQAGYTKLHLDASMRLADDDPSRPLDVQVAAGRTSFLAGVAEQALQKVSSSSPGLRYIIGSEVPIPGGAMQPERAVSVTKVEDARATISAMQAAFLGAGLGPAWERVIALVVQPGVEFGVDFVLDYDPVAARPLARFAETIPLVYEAHSTDYQTGTALRQLVRDHFAILKVGPALTFAFREAVFALALMENELVLPDERSRLIETLDRVMLREPAYWQGHYHGTPSQMAFSRKYGLSDRIRYYWAHPQVQSALERLLHNLGKIPLPRPLVSQFMPAGWEKICTGQIENTPRALILDRVLSVLDDYILACRPG